MINRILSARIDNRYRGHPLALWFFVPIAFMKVAVSLVHLFMADGGAQSISTMPLDTYSPSAAQNVVGLFARMGLEQLVLGTLFVIVGEYASPCRRDSERRRPRLVPDRTTLRR